MTIKAWQGPSTIDGQDIMAVVSCEKRASNNDKTGDMVQVGFMRTDMKPSAAVKEGKDRSICGDCPLRAQVRKDTGNGEAPCYVNTMWKASTWKAATALKEDIDAAVKAMKRKPVRCGEYGNMSSIPREVAEELLMAASKGWTLYDHEWRKADNQWLRSWAMASVHSMAEALEAQARGWRTFRVRGPDDPLMDNEIQCPHRTCGVQCRDCLLCDGKRMTTIHGNLGTVLRPDMRKNISEIAH